MGGLAFAKVQKSISKSTFELCWIKKDCSLEKYSQTEISHSDASRIIVRQHIQIDGKPLRARTTTFTWKHIKGTHLIGGSKSKKVCDWATRSHFSKSVMIGHEEGSTTRCLWA